MARDKLKQNVPVRVIILKGIVISVLSNRRHILITLPLSTEKRSYSVILIFLVSVNFCKYFKHVVYANECIN